MTVELLPCGTLAAHGRHKARGEAVDDACREAARRYQRAMYAASAAVREAHRARYDVLFAEFKQRETFPLTQVARFRAAQRAMAVLRDEFRPEWRVLLGEAYAEKGVPARRRRPPLAPCGTRAAYVRHLRRGEDPCGLCREANRRLARDRRARVAAEAVAAEGGGP